MEIFYDREKTAEINEKLWQKWGLREKKWSTIGYNCSEVTYCEFKTYNRRTGLTPQPPSRQSVGYLIFGIISEQIVMSIYPKDERQYKLDLNNIIFGHADACENKEYVIEGKASAKRLIKKKNYQSSGVCS